MKHWADRSHTTPRRSTLVPLRDPPLGGAVELATLIALSSLVSELCRKKVVMSESDKEEEEEQDVDPLIKLAKVAAASNAHVDVSPGADIPPSPPLPTGMMLWGDLQVLFESHEGGHGSLVWSDQQQWHIRSWRLFPFSNVHVLETISGKVMYMFVDGSYPLSV
ncbi:hypothetical protein Tco_0090410 [Tanacetum coccineum]